MAMESIEYILVALSWAALVGAAVYCFKIVKESEKK
jgi:hypothetical protein